MAKRISNKSIISVMGYIDYDDTTIANIFNTFSINADVLETLNYYDEYTICEKDRWDLLSYKFYGTTDYWWLLAMFNKVKDPFTALVTGNRLRIIKPEFLSTIMMELKK